MALAGGPSSDAASSAATPHLSPKSSDPAPSAAETPQLSPKSPRGGRTAVGSALRAVASRRPSVAEAEPGRARTKQEGPADREVDLGAYWRSVSQQTRTEQLESVLERRAKRRLWSLAAGEGLDWEHIRNRRYDCAVPLGPGQAEAEASADTCIEELVANRPAGAPDIALLDMGCGVGAFLARLLRDEVPGIDWAATFGVTSVHPHDTTHTAPPPGHPDFFDERILRFDLDLLAQRHALGRTAEGDGLGGRKFDFITSHYCFCHLKDPLGALCVAFSLLRPGGCLMLIEPFRETSVALPYSDEHCYSFTPPGATEPEPVRFHRDLLPVWAQAGIPVFSSCRRKAPFRHALALRKPVGKAASLPLPPGFGAASPAGWKVDQIRDSRACDLERPFVWPPGADDFAGWLRLGRGT